MKGKTSCPNCGYDFIMDMPDDSNTHLVDCPKCAHTFSIRRAANSKSDEEQVWEEYGEPRKTILSSIKRKTNKPLIASFLLLATGVLGIFTAIMNSSSSNLNIQPFEGIIANLSWLPLGDLSFSIALVVFSIFALIGSITVYKRRYFVFTAVCAILGILSIGLIVGLVLAIIALELIIVSRDEFENGMKGKVF